MLNGGTLIQTLADPFWDSCGNQVAESIRSLMCQRVLNLLSCSQTFLEDKQKKKTVKLHEANISAISSESQGLNPRSEHTHKKHPQNRKTQS